MEDREHYSNIATKFDTLYRHRAMFKEPLGKDFMKIFSPGHDIVDMACGSGYVTGVLDEQGIKGTILVDPSKDFLDVAKAAFPSSKSYNMTAYEFSKWPIKYDRMIIAGSIHHFPPETLEQTLRNVRSQMNDGGRIVIISNSTGERREEHTYPVFDGAKGKRGQPASVQVELLKEDVASL